MSLSRSADWQAGHSVIVYLTHDQRGIIFLSWMTDRWFRAYLRGSHQWFSLPAFRIPSP